MNTRYAAVALWIAYGLLVILVAVQLWAMERAVNEIKELECNLASVSLVENTYDEETEIWLVGLINESCEGVEFTVLSGGGS